MFRVLNDQLIGLPPFDPSTVDASAEPTQWDRDTWGTTPAAQEQAIRAAELLGGVR